jgi:hypothetical protein
MMPGNLKVGEEVPLGPETGQGMSQFITVGYDNQQDK